MLIDKANPLFELKEIKMYKLDTFTQCNMFFQVSESKKYTTEVVYVELCFCLTNINIYYTLEKNCLFSGDLIK